MVDINVASASVNPVTYTITITETDGSTHTINLKTLIDNATKAQNGLSKLPTGETELGGTLLHLTTIDTASNALNILNLPVATPSQLPNLSNLAIDDASGQLVRADSNPKYIYGGTSAIYPTIAITNVTDNINFPGASRDIPLGDIIPPFIAPAGKNWKANINMWVLPIVVGISDRSRIVIGTKVNGSENTSATGYGSASNDMLVPNPSYEFQPYILQYSAIFNINTGNNPLEAIFGVVVSGGAVAPTYNYNVFNVRWQASLELYNN
jgi:hypothetical protein